MNSPQIRQDLKHDLNNRSWGAEIFMLLMATILVFLGILMGENLSERMTREIVRQEVAKAITEFKEQIDEQCHTTGAFATTKYLLACTPRKD